MMVLDKSGQKKSRRTAAPAQNLCCGLSDERVESGVAVFGIVITHSTVDSPCLTDNRHILLCSRNGCIQECSAEHTVVLPALGNDNSSKF